MSSDLTKEEIAIAAISSLIQSKEVEVESIGRRLETLKTELFSLHETKKILSVSCSSASGEELLAASDNYPNTLERRSTHAQPQQLQPESGDNHLDTPERRGTPEDWLFPQFKHLGSKRSIEKILEERKAPVEIEELVKVLYDTKSNDEYRRARNSLSAGLRRGADEGFWKKIGRSFYEANSVKPASNMSRRYATDVLASIDYDLDLAELDPIMTQRSDNNKPSSASE